MTISVNKKIPMKVKFFYKNKSYIINCHKEDKIFKACNEFASKKGLNLNNLSFIYETNPINDLNNNTKELFYVISENSKTNVQINTDITKTSDTNEDDINNIKKLTEPEEILIKVYDNNNYLTCSKNTKK